jgi:sugar phosphate isomerase/epimerase
MDAVADGDTLTDTVWVTDTVGERLPVSDTVWVTDTVGVTVPEPHAVAEALPVAEELPEVVPVAEAVAIMRTAVARAASVATPACPLLLETPAGQGTELLTKPEEFIDFVESFATPTLHACLDTCHVFACGHCPVKYVDAMLAKPDLLKLIHYNDSMDLCGACKDRHAYVGTGKIGLEALTAVAEHAVSAGIPMVME